VSVPGPAARDPSAGARSVIAIDGLDGSGKSYFAGALAAAAEAAGRRAVILHVDDHRLPVAFEGQSAEGETALYYDRYYDFPALGGALAAFLSGGTDGALAVIEGVFVLRADLPAGTPLVVLEVSPGEARRRILSRDLAKGRTPEEIARRIERRYFPAQARYRAAFDPLTRADILIDNDDWTRPRVVRRDDARFPPALVPGLDRLLSAG
jgi:uridine kinase